MKFFILFILIVCSSSCNQQSGCTEFGADNYNFEAKVDDGSCIPAREKFLGDFSVESNCVESSVTLSITPATNKDEVILSSLLDTLMDVKARVFLKEITIEEQEIGTGLFIEGAGVSLGQDTISLSYRIRVVRNGAEQTNDCFDEYIRM